MQSIKLKEIELNAINRKADKVNQTKAQLDQLNGIYQEAQAELEESINVAFESRGLSIPVGSHIEIKDGSLVLNIPVTKGVKPVKKAVKPVKKK